MAEVSVQQAFDRVLRLRQAGRRADADSLYRHIVAQIPNEPNALHTLGVLAHRAGQNEFAADLIGRAVALAPDDAEYHENLGVVLAASERWGEAAAAFERAVELDPSVAETCLNAAHALRRSGRPAEAMARYRQAIALKPDLVPAHNNLGNLLRESGRIDEAIAAFRKALEHRPDYVEAQNNLASALLETGQPEASLQHYQRAIAARPDVPELYNNLGKAHRAAGDVPAAIAAHEKALALKPDDADAHWNLSLMLLLSGQFERGWNEYEWRWAVPEFRSPRPDFRQPQWVGQPLQGKRILLHAEQGFGDTIQFCRYAPLVAQQGGRVILECPPELHRLLQILPGVEQLIAAGEPLPEFDFHSPLLSLPRIFRTRIETVPNFVAYLQADAAQAARWQHRLPLPTDQLRVGLVWAGSAANPNDRNRSITLDALAPLLRVPDVRFYSLQTGRGADPARDAAGEFKSIVGTDGFEDFADTASLIANLDLVISVDTAVAHLAGAMAVPVWALLPFGPDWRWLLDRQDSPWYPTMRLFRQPRRGNWQSVVQSVASELQQVVMECLPQFLGR
ncbi:MAG TPA: tetratricopeptide repeat protein, partial [Tepidisphaeraceae bacterium]|jgi:Tfp pilus assembly protein PilF